MPPLARDYDGDCPSMNTRNWPVVMPSGGGRIDLSRGRGKTGHATHSHLRPTRVHSPSTCCILHSKMTLTRRSLLSLAAAPLATAAPPPSVKLGIEIGRA